MYKYAFNKFKAIKVHTSPPKKVETKKNINSPYYSLPTTKLFKTNRMINTSLILG